MAETTALGFKKPAATELVKGGADIIAFNAQKSQDLIAAANATDSALSGRIGAAEAAINAGAGGPGVAEDPDHPGLYYFAGPAFAVDPAYPGLYMFEETP